MVKEEGGEGKLYGYIKRERNNRSHLVAFSKKEK